MEATRCKTILVSMRPYAPATSQQVFQIRCFKPLPASLSPHETLVGNNFGNELKRIFFQTNCPDFASHRWLLPSKTFFKTSPGHLGKQKQPSRLAQTAWRLRSTSRSGSQRPPFFKARPTLAATGLGLACNTTFAEMISRFLFISVMSFLQTKWTARTCRCGTKGHQLAARD